MDGIRQADDLGISVVGKFHGLQGSHGVPWEADANHDILIADTNHLLKGFADAGAVEQCHVSPYHVQVEL